MSKKDNKNKNNNNFQASQQLTNKNNNLILEKQESNYKILCWFVDEYGQEGDWIELDVSLYLKQINFLTATTLIDYLFSKLFNIDETNIKICQDEQNYVLLNHQDSKSIINFYNNSIKLQLKRNEFSIYQRLMKLETENKTLKDQIQQMQNDQKNDLKINTVSSKQEEDDEADDENQIDLAILFSDPLIEMKRTIQPYQESVSYHKEIQELKRELSYISKQVKIKITNLSIDNLQKICKQNKPTILHIICHGSIESKGKYLHFENSDHSLQKVNPDELRKILYSLGDQKPKLVFVNACNSAIVRDVFREAGIPFVVSVDQNHSIIDVVAQNFSKYFYRNIIQNGKSIQELQELFKNAQEITDKVIQGQKNYPCCCLHDHKKDCKWFNGDDQNPNHLDHILDCNCPKQQLQKHNNKCSEANNFVQKYKHASHDCNQNNGEQNTVQKQKYIFTCCCYTYEELKEKNLLYHKECQKYKLDSDPSSDFFNKPLFKKKKNGKLVDISEFCIEQIQPTIFVRKIETYNVLKALKDPNYKFISILGKARVGKSLFVNKIIEYSQLRGLYKDNIFSIDLRDVSYCEQAITSLKKNSKKELIESMENQDALIYFKDCDKIFERDGTNFVSLLQELSRNTKNLKIIMTISKDFYSPFFSFYLKDFLVYDTRIFLNQLLQKEDVQPYRRKTMINDFLNNPKIQRTPHNIQYFAKYKNFQGLETTNDENFQNWYNEFSKDHEIHKITSIMSFFKQGLCEHDFILLQTANLISKDWVHYLQKIILTVESRTSHFRANGFQDLYQVVRGKNIILSKGRIKIANFSFREFLVEQSFKSFEFQMISLQLFSSVLTRKERKVDWKMIKLIDFSIYSPNIEVFRDVIPKVENPVIRAQEQLDKEDENEGERTNWISDTNQYIGSLLDKTQLINENMSSDEIEKIVEQLISMMKINISKNFLLKPICYWGQRFFQRYLQLIPEKKLKKEEQIKKADIYLDLILLDIQINEKNGIWLVKQHFENINFIIKKLEGMDFAKVIESQLYQCQAFLLLLVHYKDLLSSLQQQDEEEKIQTQIQKDKEFIMEAIDKSNMCISKDCSSQSENYVYKDLNAAIRHKNSIFKIEHKILFDSFSLTVEDKSTILAIQKKYHSEKNYKNCSIIYETIMNHIQLQIYKNQIAMGKTEAFNHLNHHIESRFPQLKDEENVYGAYRIKIYKLLIQQYREECTKGLIYIMNSQPLIDFVADLDNSAGSQSSLQKGSKQSFRYLSQPYYSIWQYNDILRNQAFLKSKKQIKFSFLSFNRKNYNIATSSGCQILSINSNFDEDSHLKTFQFEGSQLLEVDQYEKEEFKVIEKIQKLSKIRVLLLCINNGVAIKNLIQDNIDQSHNRAIIYFPFKETCKAFDKVLICQKFQLEFLKFYLNQSGRSIKDCFEKAKEQTKNFIFKKFEFKKEKNQDFGKIFGDVPLIFSSPDQFIEQPISLEEKEPPQEITPLIKHSNFLEQINMDKIILKSRDIYQIKNFFNESEVRLVNLHSQNGKTGKTTLALSFAMTLLERNLHFTGGIHFIQNKHSNWNLQKQQNLNQSYNLQFSQSTNTLYNDMNMSNSNFSLQPSLSASSNISQSHNHQISLKNTLENLEPSLFKYKGYYSNVMGNQTNMGQFNNQHHSHDQHVLIILSGFDCFPPRSFEFLFDRKYFPNYKFLNISNRRFALNSTRDYSKILKNHEVLPYKNTLSRLLANHKIEEEEEINYTQKKADAHHQTNKNNKTKIKQKPNNSKHAGGGNSNQNQGLTSSPITSLNIDGNCKQIGIQSQLSQIIPKTTPYLISLKTNKNQQSSKSFSSDNTSTLTQQQSAGLNDLAINQMNSSESILFKGQKDKEGFFDEIDKELLKQDIRQPSNSIQLTPFSQQSQKGRQSFQYGSKESKQFGEYLDNTSEFKQNSQQLYEEIRYYDDQEIDKDDFFQADLLSETNESVSDFTQKPNKKNREYFGSSQENLTTSQMKKGIRKPRYTSSEDNDNKNFVSSQQQNTQFELESNQDECNLEDIEQHHSEEEEHDV